jgi:hypothetical protein
LGVVRTVPADSSDPRQGPSCINRARCYRQRACDEAVLPQLFGPGPPRILYPPQPEAEQADAYESQNGADCYANELHKPTGVCRQRAISKAFLISGWTWRTASSMRNSNPFLFTSLGIYHQRGAGPHDTTVEAEITAAARTNSRCMQMPTLSGRIVTDSGIARAGPDEPRGGCGVSRRTGLKNLLPGWA